MYEVLFLQSLVSLSNVNNVLVNYSHLSDGELYVPIVVSSEPVAPSINVAEFIRESSEESGWDAANMKSEVLPLSHAAKVLCGLSQEVDR